MHANETKTLKKANNEDRHFAIELAVGFLIMTGLVLFLHVYRQPQGGYSGTYLAFFTAAMMTAAAIKSHLILKIWTLPRKQGSSDG